MHICNIPCKYTRCTFMCRDWHEKYGVLMTRSLTKNPLILTLPRAQSPTDHLQWHMRCSTVGRVFLPSGPREINMQLQKYIWAFESNTQPFRWKYGVYNFGTCKHRSVNCKLTIFIRRLLYFLCFTIAL